MNVKPDSLSCSIMNANQTQSSSMVRRACLWSLALVAAGTLTGFNCVAADKGIRINAGATAPYTDSAGNTWLADQGFDGGKTVDRGKLDIAGTTVPDIYRTEHYAMKAFAQAVPNGAYMVKLHFAETFAKITAKGQRVFSVKVEDQEVKDLDVVAKAGAPKTAWVETVNVNVSDGKLDITFTPGVQSVEINGIEILPR
jgi:endoglucanase